MNVSEESTVLSSWKDIAKYLGKGVRTVQRWESHLGLPVRRPIGTSQKSAVLLYRGDVDAWLATRFSARAQSKNEVPVTGPSCSARSAPRSALKESIRAARALRNANHALTEQITASIRLLTERCDLLTTQGLRDPLQAELARPAERAALALTKVPELVLGQVPASGRETTEQIA